MKTSGKMLPVLMCLLLAGGGSIARAGSFAGPTYEAQPTAVNSAGGGDAASASHRRPAAMGEVALSSCASANYVFQPSFGNIMLWPEKAPGFTAAIGASEGSVDLTWTAPKADGSTGTAGGYSIRLSSVANESPAKSEAQFLISKSATDYTTVPAPGINGAAQQLTIPTLIGGASYYFAIKSRASWDGWGYLSAGATAQARLYTPSNAGFSGVSGSSIDFFWAANGNASPGAVYRVLISTAADPENPATGQVVTTSETYNLSLSSAGLDANTVYRFKAAGLNSNGVTTSYTAVKATATLANPVAGPQLYGVFRSSVSANWLPCPAAPQKDSCAGYIFQADTDPGFGNPVSSITYQTAVTTLAVIGLNYSTQYYFRYGSLNLAYFQPNYYSTGAAASTLPPPPPAGPAASAVFLSSIAVNWTTVASPAGYIVEASTAADFTGTLHSTKTLLQLSSLSLEAATPQLSSNTVYNIRAGSLWGNATSYASYFTTSTLANIVVNPVLYGVFVTSVTANWLPRPEAPLEDSCSGYILQADEDPAFGSPVSSVTAQGPVAVTTLTVTGLTDATQYYFRFGTLNTARFVPNYYSTGTVATTRLAYINCGLKYSPDGVQVVIFACEPLGVITSPLRIYKAPDKYGIVLVDPADPDATKIRIKTSSGVKAIRKYP